MNEKRLIAAAVAACMCASCAMTHTRTNQDANYQGHPSRVFVVANLEAAGGGVSGDFYRAFSKSVTDCGGQTDFLEPRVSSQADALSLDNTAAVDAQKEFEQKASGFAPDVILTMHVAHVTLAGYGQRVAAVIDSRVWDYRQKKFVWAGESNMALGGIWATSEMRAKSLSDDVSSKLRQGGLIPSCSASAT
jgi:hypothetical protein